MDTCHCKFWRRRNSKQSSNDTRTFFLLYMNVYCILSSSAADPDPKDPHKCAGTGSRLKSSLITKNLKLKISLQNE